MKTKLYKKWLKYASEEFSDGVICNFANGVKDIHHYSSIEWRLRRWKNFIGTSKLAKKRMVLHIIAWGMMADHSSRWARFKKQYQKYSKAYWNPEAQLKRTIETGDSR